MAWPIKLPTEYRYSMRAVFLCPNLSLHMVAHYVQVMQTPITSRERMTTNTYTGTYTNAYQAGKAAFNNREAMSSYPVTFSQNLVMAFRCGWYDARELEKHGASNV